MSIGGESIPGKGKNNCRNPEEAWNEEHGIKQRE